VTATAKAKADRLAQPPERAPPPEVAMSEAGGAGRPVGGSSTSDAGGNRGNGAVDGL
jgi:hypothetical protein